MTERQKMEKGLVYDANFDHELLEMRKMADELSFDFNNTRPGDTEKRNEILRKLIPSLGENTTILSPFLTDYGVYSHIGSGCFINHGAYLMDGGGIYIGDNVFIGPSCGFYTALHPLLSDERNAGLEVAKPIRIGSSVWIGASVTVLPGVTIGDGAVIGAGSVVTKDIPENAVALGNPAKVRRFITEEDRLLQRG